MAIQALSLSPTPISRIRSSVARYARRTSLNELEGPALEFSIDENSLLCRTSTVTKGLYMHFPNKLHNPLPIVVDIPTTALFPSSLEEDTTVITSFDSSFIKQQTTNYQRINQQLQLPKDANPSTNQILVDKITEPSEPTIRKRKRE